MKIDHFPDVETKELQERLNGIREAQKELRDRAEEALQRLEDRTVKIMATLIARSEAK